MSSENKQLVQDKQITVKELIEDISSLINCGIHEKAVPMIDIENECLYIDGWAITLPIKKSK